MIDVTESRSIYWWQASGLPEQYLQGFFNEGMRVDQWGQLYDKNCCLVEGHEGDGL
jgi:hypothetical protein